MTDANQVAIEALRGAVEAAPDNIVLATQLSNLLVELLRYDEAEQTIRLSLSHHPGNVELQLALADIYLRDGKDSHATAIVETLVKGKNPSPAAMVMHARLLQRGGDIRSAVSTYRDAIDKDEDVADAGLESLLGIEDFRESDSESNQADPAAWQDGDPDEQIEYETERPDEGFESVGGMESVKEEIRVKIIYPLQHAEMYAAYGKKIGGGILLYGPPGCGKTHLARATAGEVNSGFMSIGINDVLDMWIGNSEKNLHALFDQARRSKPCVLFFDEVDALGASRSDMRRSGGRQLINQFLSELDGVSSSNDGLLCLAATNTPWHLDTAFRRPGRFDRVIFIPPPDAEARAEILQIQLTGKPTDDVDVKKLAAKTADFSGADLKAVVDRAIETKLMEAVKTGMPKPLTTKELLAAAKTVRPSTREWFSTARNHALYANEGGLYDEILDYLNIK
ncbi:ATP-dependent zinc metalloprotease FtsH [Rubripirellula obstinata]|uniref:ATP-dependent zinc metalloprotease FtsH n=1 Tax=Rubripirellula obstinata TaxID=406547 RepID=A0A5B1CDK5_9BACT|nr:ATP-binding protein [Rubripirellula obstinata]KAA1257660.1 ATP-dependent zinc metalloprotease FtsH [Rubripirellula obstinata]